MHTDPERGTPTPLPAGFDAVWGVSARVAPFRPGSRIRARLADAQRTPWPLRAVDLDVVGHVNNAAYWAPIEDELARRGGRGVTRAEIEFRAGLDRRRRRRTPGRRPDDGFAAWLIVGDDVRASMLVGCARDDDKQLKLGYMIGYWGARPPAGVPEGLLEAERLGFDSCWTAEAYGSDALTPLAWWGAADVADQTRHVDLPDLGAHADRDGDGRAHARPLSGGRFILGLGASGPQVAEGWYGDDYRKPLARTREYVDIIRQVLAREAPVEFHGEHYQLPLPGGIGLGKPLKSITHPLRADLPIYLAAEGPKNVALSAEIADGWLPMFYAPRVDGFYRDALAEGFARPGARHTRRDVRGRVSRAGRSSPTTSKRRPTCTARCSRCTSAAWARAR